MKLFLNYISAIICWVVLFIFRIVFILLGLFIVPIALMFKVEVDSIRTPSWADWKLIRLPMWAWFWDNKRDGALGDIRGRYWFEQRPEFIKDNDFLKMYNWMAIRNPANNFSRFLPVVSVDVSTGTCKTLQGIDKMGETGFQFVRCISKHKLPYWGLYYKSSKQYFGRHIDIRIGHKLEISYNTADWSNDPEKAQKGMTFRIGLRKD